MPNAASTSTNTAVQIDAQRMAGVTRWEDNNSRSDLLIEDVRIASDKITKQITIAMVETDPGNVDFGVYFDPYSLRTSATATSSFQFKLRDGLPGIDPITNPLGNLNVDGVLFTLGGASIQLKTPAIDAAVTYVQLAAALNAAIAAQSNAAGLVAAVGSTFTEVNTVPATGNFITITDTQGRAFDVNSFTFTHSTAPTGAFVELGKFESGTTITSTDLVTSTVVLDDVGRGSTGGDLVIGSLSVGDTSNSRGVERFEITVLDNSKLQHISSTNNTLMEVTIANGATSTASNTYINTVNPVVLNAGNLTVRGNATENGGTGVSAGAENKALPGTTNATTGTTHSDNYGFTDVRLIDGSAMTGKLTFNAEITANSIAKYINRVDTATDPAADNIAFTYSGGGNNDTISVNIDAAVAGSRSDLLSGREDFTFTINGNGGNDNITATIENVPAKVGNLDNWYNNQDLNNNITINGGAGNDVIRTPGAGDKIIDGGADNDWIFTENTGALASAGGPGAVNTTNNAAWVLNTTDQVNVFSNTGALAARNINDIRSDVNNTYNLHNTKLFVTFLGIQSATITLANTTTYKTTDLEINQAIKNAINTDPVLKAMLVAKDGPANSLIVESLIDGARVTGNFQVTLAAPTAAFTASEVTAINTAWGQSYADSAAALAGLAGFLNGFNNKGDYVSVLATDGGKELTGANGLDVTDNFITPGAGDDIIVLSTKAPGVDVARSSNEVIIYGPGFGNDTIVNFDATGNGIDHLNLNAFLKNTTAATLGALGATTSTIVITPEITATNGTATLIKTQVEAATQPAAGVTTNQVYIAYSNAGASFSDATNNIAKVYSITNGSGASDAVVTLEGTIDLANTSWSTLTAANFNVPVANASLPFGTGTLKNFIASEGPSTAVLHYQTAFVANQVMVGTADIDIFNTGGFAAVNMTGLGGADVFNVDAAGAVITDLTTGDSFAVTAGSLAATTAAFVATADTTTSVAVGSVVLTSSGAGSTINMSLASSTTAAGYTLTGGAGNDTLTGSAFNDVLSSGATGTDVLNGGAGNDTMSSGGGTVTFNGGTGTNGITAGAGVDTINTASGAIDNITAFATAGLDVITVAAGGIANVTAGAPWTATAASSNSGALTVNASVTGTYSFALLGGTNGVTVNTSTAVAHTVIGTGFADTFNVGAGSLDTITGGAGADAYNLTVAGTVQTVVLGASGTITGSTGANMDTINTFTTTEDKIQLTSGATTVGSLLGLTLVAGNGFAILNAPVADAVAVNSLSDVYAQLAIDLPIGSLAASVAGGATLVAREVTFANGTNAGTYLVLNDSVGGFQAGNDVVIKLTGVSTVVAAGDLTVV
jgi:hypothetical protein